MIAFALSLALLQDVPKEDSQLKELRDAWTKIVTLCTEEKKDDVQKAVAAMEGTREEFVALFGEEKTAKVFPRYQETWKDVLKEAPGDLVKRAKDGGWNEVEAWCLNTAEEKDLAGQDKSALAALADKDAKLYAIRLKKKDAKDGYVLRCFVKTKEGWRFLLKIGKALDEK